MGELIPIVSNGDVRAVDGRELHSFLEVKSKYATWIQNRIKKYGFVQGIDFEAKTKILENGGRSIDYIISIETAKELCMVENNIKGRDARRYFIRVEQEAIKLAKQQTVSNVIGIKEEFEILQMTASFLNMGDSSKLELTHKFYEAKGLDTNLLPNYTSSKGALLSLSELLKRNDINLSAVAVNKLLLADGYLEERERPSSKGVKKFKAISEKGFEYGENQVSPQNKKEVAPQYYEHSFIDLMKKIEVK